MKRWALALLVSANLGACTADEVRIPYGGQTCIAAVELYCRTGGDMAPIVKTDPSDPDLGLCLPFMNGAVRSQYGSRDGVTTFTYDDSGRLIDLASECGQGETIHTRAEVGSDGRIERWVTDMDLIEDDVANWPYMVSDRQLLYADDGQLLGDDATITVDTEDPPFDIEYRRTLDPLPGMYGRMTDETLSRNGWGERRRGLVRRPDGRIGWVYEVLVNPRTSIGSTFRRVDYEYDEAGHVVRVSDVEAEGERTDRIDAAYEWDGDELVRRVIHDTGKSCDEDGTIPFLIETSYDHAGRMVGVEHHYCGNSEAYNEVWEFDEHGRPVQWAWETWVDEWWIGCGEKRC